LAENRLEEFLDFENFENNLNDSKITPINIFLDISVASPIFYC